jgi:hypothetical protein
VCIEELVEGVNLKHRNVATGNNDGSVEIFGQRHQGTLDGSASAWHGILVNRGYGREKGSDVFFENVALVSNHRDDMLCA